MDLIFDVCGTPTSSTYKNYSLIKPDIRELLEKRQKQNNLAKFLESKDWTGKMSETFKNLI